MQSVEKICILSKYFFNLWDSCYVPDCYLCSCLNMDVFSQNLSCVRSISSTIAAGSGIGLTIPDAVCTVLCSWWWAEESPETCRATYRNRCYNENYQQMRLFVLCLYFLFLVFSLHVSGFHEPIVRGITSCCFYATIWFMQCFVDRLRAAADWFVVVTTNQSTDARRRSTKHCMNQVVA